MPDVVYPPNQLLISDLRLSWLTLDQTANLDLLPIYGTKVAYTGRGRVPLQVTESVIANRNWIHQVPGRVILWLIQAVSSMNRD